MAPRAADCGRHEADRRSESRNVAEAGERRAATGDLDVTDERLSPESLLHKPESDEELSLTELAYPHGHDDVRRDRLARHVADDETSTTAGSSRK